MSSPTSLIHRFRSAKSDSPDPTLVQPSEWNDTHKFSTPDGISGGDGVLIGTDVAGEMSINGVLAPGALTYLRRNAANTGFEFVTIASPTYPDGVLTSLGNNLSGKVAGGALQFFRRNAANNDFEFASFSDGFQLGTGGILTGSAATGGLQRLRRNIANLSYEWADDRYEYNFDEYNFIPIAVGVSLVPGANTITLANVPIGVNGADLNHYLWVSGGTGTAEKVLITGGTAISGGQNQTLIITCANNHTGAWTLASATAGLQEAIQAIAITAGKTAATFTCNPAIQHLMHAGVVWPDNGGSYVLDGRNPLSFSFFKSSEFTSGDLFSHAGNVNLNYVVYQNIGISSGAGTQTAGALINITRAIGYVLNCRLTGGYDAIVLNGSSARIAGNFYNGAVHTEITLQQSGGVVCNDVLICNEIMFPSISAPYSILLKACDGINILNVIGSQSNNALVIQPPGDGVSYCASGTIDGFFWDIPAAGGVTIIAGGGGIGSWKIANSQVNGGTDAAHRTTQFGLFSIGNRGGGGQISNISLVNCIGGFGLSNGFEFGNSLIAESNITVSNCQSFGNGTNGFFSTFIPSISFSNCCANDNVGYGYSILSASYASVIGGQYFNNGNGNTINFSGVTVAILHGILGFSNIIPATVTNAATVIFPPYPLVKISGGGTAITTINGPLFAGWRVHIVNTGTSTTVGGGGNVPTAHTIGAGLSLDLMFDGVNWV